MASKDSFLRGVLQNFLGSLLAGLTLLFLGRAWFLNRFGDMLEDVKGGLAQVAVIQEKLDRLGAAPTPQPTPDRRGHRHSDGD